MIWSMGCPPPENLPAVSNRIWLLDTPTPQCVGLPLTDVTDPLLSISTKAPFWESKVGAPEEPLVVIMMALSRAPADVGFASSSVSTTVSVPFPGVIAAKALQDSPPQLPVTMKLNVVVCAFAEAETAIIPIIAAVTVDQQFTQRNLGRTHATPVTSPAAAVRFVIIPCPIATRLARPYRRNFCSKDTKKIAIQYDII